MVSPPKKLLLLLLTAHISLVHGRGTKTILSWAQLFQDLSPTKSDDQPTLPPGPVHNDYGDHGVHSDDVVARHSLPARSKLTKSSSTSTTGPSLRPQPSLHIVLFSYRTDVASLIVFLLDCFFFCKSYSAQVYMLVKK